MELDHCHCKDGICFCEPGIYEIQKSGRVTRTLGKTTAIVDPPTDLEIYHEAVKRLLRGEQI